MAVLAILEPQHRSTHDPPLTQIRAHPRLDGAQVLAHDEGAGTVGLQGQDTDHGLMVVPDVRSHARAKTGWDPPQPEQAEDVVDTDTARMSQGRPHHLTEGLVGHVGQHVRTHRRLAPLLTGLVEGIRRGADGDTVGKEFTEHPRICSGTRDADSHVTDEAQGHPGVTSGRLGGRELLVSNPLQPHEEVDAILVSAHELRDGSVAGTLEPFGPFMPVVAVDLGQRTPGGQIDQTGAAQPAEGLVGQLSRPFQTEGVDGFEDRQLGVPGTVTVDRLSGRSRMSLGGAGLGTLVGVEV